MLDKDQLQEKLQDVLNRNNNKEQYNYNAIKSSFEMLPAGPGLANFYLKYVKSPAEERLNNFLNTVVESLLELEIQINSNLDYDNPKFQTTFMYGLQIASRNHQEEKLNSLRYAILNSINNTSFDDDREKIFLNLIDEFTTLHIKVLSSIENYGGAAFIENKDIKDILPNFYEQYELYEQILKDLLNSNLIRDNSDYSFRDPEPFNSRSKFDLEREFSNIESGFGRTNLNSVLRDLKGILANYQRSIEEERNRFNSLIRHQESIYNQPHVSKFIKKYNEKRWTMNFGITDLGQNFIDFITSPVSDKINQ